MVGNLILFFAALFAVVQHNNVDPGLVGFALSYALSVTQVRSSLFGAVTLLTVAIVP